MLIRCPVEGCKFVPKEKRGWGGHIAAHKAKGELPDGKKPAPTPIPALSPEKVADVLLKRVVDAINADDLHQTQLKEAKARILALEAEVKRVREEKDRILRLHNEQVKRGDGHMTSSEELVRIATAPISKLRG